jgi:hypothetical protein
MDTNNSPYNSMAQRPIDIHIPPGHTRYTRGQFIELQRQHQRQQQQPPWPQQPQQQPAPRQAQQQHPYQQQQRQTTQLQQRQEQQARWQQQQQEHAVREQEQRRAQAEKEAAYQAVMEERCRKHAEQKIKQQLEALRYAEEVRSAQEEWRQYEAHLRLEKYKRELASDTSKLFRRYNELLKYFPLAPGERRNQYYSQLLANRDMPEETTSELALAIQYAKNHWESVIHYTQIKEAAQWRREEMAKEEESQARQMLLRQSQAVRQQEALPMEWEVQLLAAFNASKSSMGSASEPMQCQGTPRVILNGSEELPILSD